METAPASSSQNSLQLVIPAWRDRVWLGVANAHTRETVLRWSSASGGPMQPKGGKSEPMGWGRPESCGGAGASSPMQPKLKHPSPPPSPCTALISFGFLVAWVYGGTNLWCGRIPSQSSIIHNESSPGTHRPLGSLTLSKRKRWRPPKGSAKVTR